MITEKDIADQCELIQDDLACILDGVDNETLNAVCQVIVDRLAILKGKIA
jgi:hypothetical protein